MSGLETDEFTLSRLIGRMGGRSRLPVTGVERVLSKTQSPDATLGVARLSTGVIVIVAVQGFYSLARFLVNLAEHPNPVLTLGAWSLLALTVACAAVMVLTAGERLPTWIFVTLLMGLAVSAGLDLAAVWPAQNLGAFASASISAAFSLLLMITVRSARELLVIAGMVAVVFVSAVLLTTPLEPALLPAQLVAVGTAVVPLLIGIYIVHGFRSLLKVELDRVLVQSTVSSPRFAVGMLASEELAQLDLAAERLLESVADGSTSLPLDARASSTASALATELRLHLIEGRRETWLYHAITESETLGRHVTLSDKGSLAGLLSPAQRDGLLSAIWLLVNNSGPTPRSLTLELGPATGTVPTEQGHRLRVPIDIHVPGLTRKRIDPASWGAIASVGQYSHTVDEDGVRVVVECLVDNPADR